MRKCVKVFLIGVRDPDALVTFIKRTVKFAELEGLVETVVPDALEIVLYGLKDAVDAVVASLELAAAKKGVSQKQQISFSVEPHVKDEDYRGVVRFIKKAEPKR